MVFWRKKKNIGEQEREAQEDKVLHNPAEPDMAPVKEVEIGRASCRERV